MKIPTIKTLFNKTAAVPKKGKVTVTPVTVMAKKTVAKSVAPKKTAVKKPAVKKVVAKKVVAKKLATTLTSVSAVKKTATKKVSASKTVTAKPRSTKKAPAGMRLVVASDSQSFWLQDGQVLNSLPALEAAFKVMTAAVYKYHALNGSNHFADWVELVLADKVCADALRTAKTAKTAHTILTKHLAVMS